MLSFTFIVQVSVVIALLVVVVNAWGCFREVVLFVYTLTHVSPDVVVAVLLLLVVAPPVRKSWHRHTCYKISSMFHPTSADCFDKPCSFR